MSIVSLAGRILAKGKKHSLMRDAFSEKDKLNTPAYAVNLFIASLITIMETFKGTLLYMVSLILVVLSTGGIYGIRRLEELEINLDMFPLVMKCCVVLLIIIGTIYLTFSIKMFVPAVILMFLTVTAGDKVYGEYITQYEEFDRYAAEVTDKSSESDFMIAESSDIYDVNGKKLATLKETSDLEYLSYDQIPDNVRNAFVAIEDRTFWENDGVDYNGILAVLYEYAKSNGESERGASTITQQLVKNIYLTSEKSIDRKLKEILIARHLTKKYTKEQILEFYINDICYGNAVYGIQGAARAYFDKDVDDLTLSETAYLCAIPNRPSYYDPYKNPDNAVTRRDKILKDMYECGYITEDEMDVALSEKISIKAPASEFNNYLTTFATDCAIRYMMQEDGFVFRHDFENIPDYQSYKDEYNDFYEQERHKLYTGGYEIKTTLDTSVYKDLQAILDENLSFDEEIDESSGIYALQGAATVIDNSTGKVVAVIGGRNQGSSVYSFNRAYQALRQPGSSIKPIIVYTPAIMKGYTDTSIVDNIDIDLAKKKGVNVQTLTGTQMTLRQAVENSKNGVAWKIFDEITPQYGLSFANEMDYPIVPSDYYNAASLGGFTYGVTTVNQAAGYATLENHGIYREPTCITSIKDRNGNEIYKDASEKMIYPAKAADDMVDILKGVLTNGTATGLKWYTWTGTEAFCKTGTTNKSKDGWLCGATPYYTIAVWVGYDQPKELSNLYGATYPGQIWKEMMLFMIDGKETAKLTRAEYKESDELLASTGYYSYLEGRDDSEVLSEGYTVADYRNDRVIGEGVMDVIGKINASSDALEIEFLYDQGLLIIDTIYSRKYTAEMTEKLNAARDSKLPQQAELGNEDTVNEQDMPD